MADNKMADDKPGPVRTVEEPPGFDTPPTDRIPVQGDLSDRRTDTEPRDRRADDVRDEHVEPPTTDPPESRTDPLEPAADPAERVTDPTERAGAPVASVTGSAEPSSLFDESVTVGFRNRWRDLQAGFVDDPAQAVRAADELVDEIMRELAERRRHIEEQWRGGPDDTEDLRMVLQEYRSFFNQLLNS